MYRLQKQLQSIHRKSYPAYKSLKGNYTFKNYHLSIDHVQGDPFASPSSVSIHIPHKLAQFPSIYFDRYDKRIALQDYLLRLFSEKLSLFSFKAKGSGKSGLLATSQCGQKVLERTACEFTETEIIVRLEIGFPANGRTINATELEKILFQFLPKCVESVFYYKNLNADHVASVIYLAEDQTAIRKQLKEKQLVCFIANGSILPRESGISDKPMRNAIPFQSPHSMLVELLLPRQRKIQGMGIKEGITLIVGGGYHGKSTLLNAIEAGVYNHIKGDGREYVITNNTAIKLRAEDGRCIKNTDISLFINDLPNKKDTRSFSTENASGSTSQAANVIEAIETESKLFLIDEDTSATNFMVRDELMQSIVTREKEPITPFLERVTDLYKQSKISTILVAGSSGSYFYAADTILQMDCYVTKEITETVKERCKKTTAPSLFAPNYKIPDFQRTIFSRKQSHHPNDRIKLKFHGKDSFQIDRQTVDLRYVEQLIDSEQTACLAYLLKYVISHYGENNLTLQEIVTKLTAQIKENGLSFVFDSSYISLGLALPRPQEIYACFNRYRG
ncbi:ABC-ATPase domain-containing protein [Faecalimonas sp.]